MGKLQSQQLTYIITRQQLAILLNAIYNLQHFTTTQSHHFKPLQPTSDNHNLTNYQNQNTKT